MRGKTLSPPAETCQDRDRTKVRSPSSSMLPPPPFFFYPLVPGTRWPLAARAADALVCPARDDDDDDDAVGAGASPGSFWCTLGKQDVPTAVLLKII